MKIQKLFLEQFTCFEKVECTFSPGVNVIIGANSTGKTHLLQLMYSILKAQTETYHQRNSKEDEFPRLLQGKLQGMFGMDHQSSLVRDSRQTQAVVHLTLDSEEIGFSLRNNTNGFFLSPQTIPEKPLFLSSVFIPTQEFLAFSEVFTSLDKNREISFNEIFHDLSIAFEVPPCGEIQDPDIVEVIQILKRLIAGVDLEAHEKILVREKGRFYFHLPEGNKNAFLISEGYRKLATLLYLLENGSLVKNSILFWDEPETNLNPKLIFQTVQILRMLAASGMQIFMTTHSYLLSYEFSLLAKQTSVELDVRFFSLSQQDRFAGIEIESGETMATLENNAILEEYAAHYERENQISNPGFF